VGWGTLPGGWRLVEVAGVATDSRDRVFVFNRGEHPIVVFDPEGRFLDSWGEGRFVRPHGITIGPEDVVHCTATSTTPSRGAWCAGAGRRRSSRPARTGSGTWRGRKAPTRPPRSRGPATARTSGHGTPVRKPAGARTSGRDSGGRPRRTNRSRDTTPTILARSRTLQPHRPDRPHTGGRSVTRFCPVPDRSGQHPRESGQNQVCAIGSCHSRHLGGTIGPVVLVRSEPWRRGRGPRGPSGPRRPAPPGTGRRPWAQATGPMGPLGPCPGGRGVSPREQIARSATAGSTSRTIPRRAHRRPPGAPGSRKRTPRADRRLPDLAGPRSGSARSRGMGLMPALATSSSWSRRAVTPAGRIGPPSSSTVALTPPVPG
jgi:hypothetical protein